jgi:hypothetical protein
MKNATTKIGGHWPVGTSLDLKKILIFSGVFRFELGFADYFFTKWPLPSAIEALPKHSAKAVDSDSGRYEYKTLPAACRCILSLLVLHMKGISYILSF